MEDSCDVAPFVMFDVNYNKVYVIFHRGLRTKKRIPGCQATGKKFSQEKIETTLFT